MSRTPKFSQNPLAREALVLLGLFVCGILVLPIAVFGVGKLVFGAYEGDGYGGFFSDLLGRLGGGNGAAWFLVLSPLLVVLLFRCLAWCWRFLAGRAG